MKKKPELLMPAGNLETLKIAFIYGADGAKGMGELTLVGAAPAVALAIENAIGKEIHKIPATPEYIMEVLENGKN